MTTMVKTKKTAQRVTKRHPAAAPAHPERYTVVIEDLVVAIERTEDGWYMVTCPFDRELVTQGRTLDEAVAMARDAKQTLAEARAKPSNPAALGGRI